jgi:peptidoglycan/xylan/chitin deacetylase (PgdA/CDA1 family)
MKGLLKKVFGTFSWVPKGARLIFVYHDISDPSDEHHHESYSTSPEDFIKQIDFLKRKFRFLSLDELLEYEGSAPAAALTFDDGFSSVLSRAAPLLRAREIPFSIFCNQRSVKEDAGPEAGGPSRPTSGGTRRYLDEQQLRELSKEGVTIGSHGSSHKPLVGRTAEELNYEIEENRRFLASILGLPIMHFAFPYGKPQHFDRNSVKAALSAGHRYLYTASPAYLSHGVRPESEWLIPRASLHKQSPEGLHHLIHRLNWESFKRGISGEA